MSESQKYRSYFEEIFREYFKPLVYYSMKITKDIEPSRDITHNVFIYIWEKNREILDDEPARIRSYLFASVRNRSFNHLRDTAKNTSLEGDDENSLEKVLSVPDEESMETTELVQTIEKAINELPEKTREVFLLSRYEGLKYGEIAQRMDISVKTVEGQMSRALRHLRKELAEYITIILVILLLEIIFMQ